MSIKRTAELLDCSPAFVNNLIKEGTLKPKYLGDRPYIFTDQLLEAMKVHDAKWTLKIKQRMEDASNPYLNK